MSWLGELIDATCAAPPVLIGQTLGGAIAATFASRRSDAARARWSLSTRSACVRSTRPRSSVRRSRASSADRTPTATTGSGGTARSISTACGDEMGDTWAAFTDYNVDRARTPSVQSALHALMGDLRLPGDRRRRAGTDRGAHHARVGTARPGHAAVGRRASQPPVTAGRCTSLRARPTTPPSSSPRRSCTCSGRCSRREHAGGGVMTAVDDAWPAPIDRWERSRRCRRCCRRSRRASTRSRDGRRVPPDMVEDAQGRRLLPVARAPQPRRRRARPAGPHACARGARPHRWLGRVDGDDRRRGAGAAGHAPDADVRRASTPRAPTSSSAAPSTRPASAMPTDGGFRVNGRWTFASGCQHSDWFLAHCIVDDGRMPPMRMMVVPAADVDDHRHVARLGLARHGQPRLHDHRRVRARRAHVPDRRSLRHRRSR